MMFKSRHIITIRQIFSIIALLGIVSFSMNWILVIKHDLPRNTDVRVMSSEAKKELHEIELRLSEALEHVAVNRTVLLTMVDEAFYPMAINFFLTCLKPYSIMNYIILTVNRNTCSHFSKYHMNCFFYKDIASSETASEYNSRVFNDKMNVRTDFVLQALQMNYSVLHTDLDEYYFSNPFLAIDCPRSSCDIAPLMDSSSAYNAGFLFINPSKASISVYQKTKNKAMRKPNIVDQFLLNDAMNEQLQEAGGLKIKRLAEDKFQCGLSYYEEGRRYFFDSAPGCDDCIVVHNNWIVSMAAKVYRAKEMHQWMYDGEDRYYTSTNRKYMTITYNVIGDEISGMTDALAISSILNRTLILPAFKCPEKKSGELCPLNSVLRIKNFDDVFGYREHSFLSHPLVPESVRSSSIVTSFPAAQSDVEISQHLRHITQSVLHINSAQSAFSGFTDPQKQLLFNDKVKRGIVRAGYRQL